MFYLIYKIDWSKQVYLAKKRSEALNKLDDLDNSDNHKESLMEASNNNSNDYMNENDISSFIKIEKEYEIG